MKRQSLTEIEKGIVLGLNDHASIVGYDTSYFYIATDLWKRKMIDVVCVGPKKYKFSIKPGYMTIRNYYIWISKD
jgi:hypothetical protein